MRSNHVDSSINSNSGGPQHITTTSEKVWVDRRRSTDHDRRVSGDAAEGSSKPNGRGEGQPFSLVVVLDEEDHQEVVASYQQQQATRISSRKLKGTKGAGGKGKSKGKGKGGNILANIFYTKSTKQPSSTKSSKKNTGIGTASDEEDEDGQGSTTTSTGGEGGNTTSGEVEDPTPLSVENQNRFVTCVSVIDENNGNDRTLNQKWASFREDYPNRPMCLLRPVPQRSNLALSLPTVFYTEGINNIYSEVTRGNADITDTSDWFEICEMEESRLAGLTKVVLFVDNSGSLETKDVRNAYDLFYEKLEAAGLEVVVGVYNGNEDYITPCSDTNLTAVVIS